MWERARVRACWHRFAPPVIMIVGRRLPRTRSVAVLAPMATRCAVNHHRGPARAVWWMAIWRPRSVLHDVGVMAAADGQPPLFPQRPVDAEALLARMSRIGCSAVMIHGPSSVRYRSSMTAARPVGAAAFHVLQPQRCRCVGRSVAGTVRGAAAALGASGHFVDISRRLLLRAHQGMAKNSLSHQVRGPMGES